jgi:hypothetical protein
MNTALSMTREQSHPPLSLPSRGLLDRAAVWTGVALLRWARQSTRLRSQRFAQQRERASRQLELNRLQRELDARRARVDTHLLFRSLQ